MASQRKNSKQYYSRALNFLGERGKVGGHLFKAGRLLTFSAFKMGAYSRWTLSRGWGLIRINTVYALKTNVRWLLKGIIGDCQNGFNLCVCYGRQKVKNFVNA